MEGLQVEVYATGRDGSGLATSKNLSLVPRYCRYFSGSGTDVSR